MPRQNLNAEGRSVNGGKCKIRKRGNSSSSSSSLVKNYRMKRPILVGKRAGSSTPVPTWKMTSSTTTSPNSHSLQNEKLVMKYQGKAAGPESMSARKLAATLWEINEVPSPLKNVDNLEQNMKLNPSHIPILEGTNRRRSRSRRSDGSSQFLLPDNNLGGLDSVRHANRLIEVPSQVGSQRCVQTTKGHGVAGASRLKDVRDSLAASKELLKVLNHVWGLEAKHPASFAVFSALNWELYWARTEVKKLIQEQANHSETDYLLKQFAEERRAWKMREQDRIVKAITSAAEECEAERKLRKQTERLNKKLGKELASTKACLSKAVKEAESEKRAREILEQVCEELARGIEEDRGEYEELKKESAKVREEVEKEREMLQLADVLREERVQMKLAEAKYEYEEKNMAVDKLKSELEEYLKAAKPGERKSDASSNDDRIKELEEYLRKTLSGSCQNRQEQLRGEVVYGDDSADSDLRSVELNMDNSRKSFEWSYSYTIPTQDDSTRISADDKIVFGKSIPKEETGQKHITLERNVSDCIEWEFSNQHHPGGVGGFAVEKLSDYPLAAAQKKDYEDEIKRYKMIKDLRDRIVSVSGLASCQGLSVIQETV